MDALPRGAIHPDEIGRALKVYGQPRTGRSLFEVGASVLPFVAIWIAMWAALVHVGYWLVLLLAVPAAGFLVRLFLIQHDCGHSSVFRRQWANDWLGRVLGVITLTPYDHWRRTHALHHAGSGNLERRGIGDVATLTVREYRALGRFGRLRYRLYRHPAILFGIGPLFVFVLHHRLPIGFMQSGAMHWTSTMGTNAAIAGVTAVLIWIVGVGPFLAIHGPIAFLGAAAGVWLFYVQHQFEHTYWDAPPSWRRPVAALEGSSHYHLPGVLRWLTANIGIHHVHHLSSRIPHYRLPEVLRDHPELDAMNRLTIADSLRSVRLSLWDEDRRRLVPFSTARLS
ncbi:fatty acid desaturase [Acuticoccus sp. M5D2P5]|nr:fatty acid desaturase [Acuticoccus kalidii]